MNVCLKQKLLEFYNETSIITKDLIQNSLPKNRNTLSIMNDFEFNLGFITQLKIREDQEKANEELDNSHREIFSKMYLYYFSFNPTFNIMLDYYLPFSEVYQVYIPCLPFFNHDY